MVSKNIIIIFMITLIYSCPAFADAAILYKTTAKSCPVTVTANKKWKVLQIRRTSDTCHIGREETLDILRHVFSAIAKNGDETKYNSVFLGRIEYYDWLSKYLIEQTLTDARWSTDMGKPVRNNAPGALNTLVGSILSKRDILDSLNVATVMARQHFTGISCEKILVSGPTTKKHEPDWTPKNARVPYDAVCWLQLGKNN